MAQDDLRQLRRQLKEYDQAIAAFEQLLTAIERQPVENEREIKRLLITYAGLEEPGSAGCPLFLARRMLMMLQYSRGQLQARAPRGISHGAAGEDA
jgi:hypothetical protein